MENPPGDNANWLSAIVGTATSVWNAFIVPTALAIWAIYRTVNANRNKAQDRKEAEKVRKDREEREAIFHTDNRIKDILERQNQEIGTLKREADDARKHAENLEKEINRLNRLAIAWFNLTHYYWNAGNNALAEANINLFSAGKDMMPASLLAQKPSTDIENPQR